MNPNPPVPPGKGHSRLERGLGETPRSRSHKGRFGRMFRSLPPADFGPDMLAKLARIDRKETPGGMVSDRETDDVTGKLKVTPETDNPPDDEENFGLPAGYTYFGQFVDHDLTFDPLSSLVKRNDPDGITNFRTPALDLDSLYGGGPNDQPYLYDGDGLKFRLDNRQLTGSVDYTTLPVPPTSVLPLTHDLPRFHGRALIGDPRNDENIVVSQLHGLFLRFHNFLADTYKGENPSFSDIQRLVRWHYQWLVLFDYLPRIVGQTMVENILPHTLDNSTIYEKKPQLNFYNYRNDPFMPVEFSVAAYRFGHSMVRPIYRLSAFDFNDPRLSAIEGLDGRKLLFHPDSKLALNGFHAFEETNGIDWHLFFDTRTNPLSADTVGKHRVQPAYKIDTSLVNPLAFLPEHSKPRSEKPKDGHKDTNNLAFRNLMRGVMLELPSGQAVARLMGLKPIPDECLLVGKANAGSLDGDSTNKSGIKAPCILDIDGGFAGKAPLWFYILAEAMNEWRHEAEAPKADGTAKTDNEKNALPTLLGPVGGRIVAEVLIGIILGDSDSFLAMEPNWKPEFGDANAGNFFHRFTMGDLIDLDLPMK